MKTNPPYSYKGYIIRIFIHLEMEGRSSKIKPQIDIFLMRSHNLISLLLPL